MNSDLQKKLYRFEADPPTGVWDRISDDLDEEQAFAQRLLNFEEEPPAKTWAAVETALNETASPARVVPFFERYKRPLRYMAAASMIAIILVSITVNTKQSETGSVATGNNPPARTQPSPPNNVSPAPNAAGNSPASQSARQPNDNAVAIATAPSPKRTLAFVQPQNLLRKIFLRGKFVPRRAAQKEGPGLSSLDNFMVYSDGDGTTMRVPKKLFGLVHCPDGDGSCKERIQQLQKKLARETASTDFAGMLDLLRQLQ